MRIAIIEQHTPFSFYTAHALQSIPKTNTSTKAPRAIITMAERPTKRQMLLRYHMSDHPVHQQ
jgi:hypothetical protein